MTPERMTMQGEPNLIHEFGGSLGSMERMVCGERCRWLAKVRSFSRLGPNRVLAVLGPVRLWVPGPRQWPYRPGWFRGTGVGQAKLLLEIRGFSSHCFLRQHSLSQCSLRQRAKPCLQLDSISSSTPGRNSLGKASNLAIEVSR
jgi:hypothetical protein